MKRDERISVEEETKWTETEKSFKNQYDQGGPIRFK